MVVNKKLGKGLSSLLGNKDISQNKTSDNKDLLLIPIEKNNYTHETLSNIVGKSRSHITNLLRILDLHDLFFDLLNKGKLSMGHARALVGKTPNDFDDYTLNQIISGKTSVRDLEKNKRKLRTSEPNLIQEEKNLSETIGFKTKITFNKKGKGNLKIYYENLEQYNFIINKLKN